MPPFIYKSSGRKIRAFFCSKFLTLGTLNEMKHIKDFGQYKIYELTNEEFNPYFETHVKKVFDDENFMYDWRSLLSDIEKEKLKALKENLSSRVAVNLGVFMNEVLIAWSIGTQETRERFYMMNSAVIPSHRRKGIYSELVRLMLSKVKELGFSSVKSLHITTNNSVIIAKLKLGFKITGIEISDIIGTLVQMTYFMNEKRNEIMDFRAGLTRPSEEIKKLFKI